MSSFDRNTKTGGETSSESEADLKRAVERAFHDPERPSRLTTPIIERD